MRQAAADGAAVPDLPVADVLGALRDDREALPQQRALEQLAIGGRRADAGALPVLLDPAQLREAGDVQQPGRLRQAELHDGQEAVPAGDELGPVALGENVEGVPERAWRARTRMLVGITRRTPFPFCPSIQAPSAGLAAWIAAHTRAGVRGLSMCPIPNGASASQTAFTRQAADAIVPASPHALDAERVHRRRRDRVVGLDVRHLAGPRHRVVHHGAGEELAVVVVDRDLLQRLAHALDHAAVNLALDDHRVDVRAAVVHRDVAEDLDLAGLGVHLDRADVGAEGIDEVARDRRRPWPRGPAPRPAGMFQARLAISATSAKVLAWSRRARARGTRRPSTRCPARWPPAGARRSSSPSP